MPDHRARLAAIKRFDQLVTYLRDDMGWPIEGDDFEEITFDYTPDELGIDAANRAKIQQIKRLRPLAANQPWGIFFVRFEPKRLPVVALRRILSRVVLKKRAAANSAERAAWDLADLLFISNYGDDAERRISFAHFVQDDDWGDLPTLKVLGWDGDDTNLHLDEVARKLTTKLRWPDMMRRMSLPGAPPGATPSPCGIGRSSPRPSASPSPWRTWPGRPVRRPTPPSPSSRPPARCVPSWTPSRRL